MGLRYDADGERGCLVGDDGCSREPWSSIMSGGKCVYRTKAPSRVIARRVSQSQTRVTYDTGVFRRDPNCTGRGAGRLIAPSLAVCARRFVEASFMRNLSAALIVAIIAAFAAYGDTYLVLPATNAPPLNPQSPEDVLTQRNNNQRTGTTLSQRTGTTLSSI